MSLTVKCGKVISRDDKKVSVEFDNIQEFIVFYNNFVEGKTVFGRKFIAEFKKVTKK